MPPGTRRVTFRALRAGDEHLLDALDRDGEVLRFLRRHPASIDEHRRTVSRLIDQYAATPGYGRFAAESGTGEFLGWFELEPDDSRRYVELGYRLHQRYWGRGLATETSRALIDYSFTSLGAAVVWAETMAVNTGSRRVMTKLGMSHVRTFHIAFDDPLPGTEHGEVRYEVTHAQWRQRR